MAAGPTYEPIATTTLDSNAPSLTLSSIPQTYTDLVLIANVSGYYASATYIDCGIQVGNGSIDTGNNYSSTVLDLNTSQRQINSNYVRFYCTATPTNTSMHSTIIIHFNNYANTNVYKPILSRYNALQTTNNTNTAGMVGGLWRSTSAINTITISNKNGTNLYSGSNISLYGIKSA